MSSVYFHLPFCKKRCNYCSFYAIASKIPHEELINSLIKEMILRKNYMNDKIITSIYFGGGTPSLIKPGYIEKLLKLVFNHYQLSKNIEITLEINPDDVSTDYLKELKSIGINRLSIGVQSFFDEHLKYFTRIHNANQAKESITQAYCVGFENISIDLIYGFQGLLTKQWEENLKRTFDLPVKHLSAYHLSIDKGTLLFKKMQNNEIKPPTEKESWTQFSRLLDMTELFGFHQYEISNFSVKDYQSKHNTTYWDNTQYLGLGPSAHSYNGISRQWNIRNTKKYLEKIKNKEEFYQVEKLTKNEQYNDLIMMSLRTSKGLKLNLVKKKFGDTYYNHCLKKTSQYSRSKHIIIDDDRVKFTRKGMFISNTIMVDFFNI